SLAAGADSLAAGADSLAQGSTDSLELLRQEAALARERLDQVAASLKDLPEEDRLRRSPRGAVIRAFALPGWGQFYTGHRFRGFLYGGAEVGFAALGVLKQREVNDFKDDISRRKLAFIGEQQAANPDTVFSRADTLALFDRFESSGEGAALEATLDAQRKRREDYFTYAIFSVLFGAIDAFISAHLEPFETTRPEVRHADGRWEVGAAIRLGSRRE
nr:hypothetical protein [Gemmatimonadota bacterium]